MAELLRAPISGSDWTAVQLCEYNIIVEFQDAATFFGVDPLPQPAVADELLNHLTADEMVEAENFKLMDLMAMMVDPIFESETLVVDSAVYLLSFLGYAPGHRIASMNAVIPFTICGKKCHAKADAYIQESQNFLFLLVEDKVQENQHLESRHGPEPQLIASAIAAFQTNNLVRELVLGQQPLTGHHRDFSASRV